MPHPLKLLLLAALCSVAAGALFHFETTGIREIDSSNFRDFIFGSERITTLFLYSTKQAKSQELAKEWKKVAQVCKDFLSFGAVDLYETGLGKSTKEENLPMISIYFGSSNPTSEKYSGEFQAERIIEFLFGEVSKELQRRASKIQIRASIHFERNADLNEQNFGRSLFGSPYTWVVKFTKEGCPYCVPLQPLWEELPNILGNKMVFATIDCEHNVPLCRRYGITGLPTVFVFPPLSTPDTQPALYEGSTSSVPKAVEALDQIYERIGNPAVPQLKQLTGKDSFFKHCFRTINGCVLYVLPQIRKFEERDRHTKMLKAFDSLANQIAKYNYHNFWVFSSEQRELCSFFDLPPVYPSIITIIKQGDRHIFTRYLGDGKFNFKKKKEYLKRTFTNDIDFRILSGIIPPFNDVKEYNHSEWVDPDTIEKDKFEIDL